MTPIGWINNLSLQNNVNNLTCYANDNDYSYNYTKGVIHKDQMIHQLSLKQNNKVTLFTLLLPCIYQKQICPSNETHAKSVLVKIWDTYVNLYASYELTQQCDYMH